MHCIIAFYSENIDLGRFGLGLVEYGLWEHIFGSDVCINDNNNTTNNNILLVLIGNYLCSLIAFLRATLS